MKETDSLLAPEDPSHTDLTLSADQSEITGSGNDDNRENNNNNHAPEIVTPELSEEEKQREYEEELRFYAAQVYLLIIPIFVTFVLTIWWARAIFLDVLVQSNNVLLVYQEGEDDSTGMKIGGALLNALIILGCILAVTVVFVCLFYFNCMKIIFVWLLSSTILILGGIGGLITYFLLYAYNIPMDWLFFVMVLWNFSAVGITSIFFKSPLWVEQGYLVIISALVATNLLQLPEWTAFALLGVVAIYDLFAVLCPKGPLKVLVNTAQERNQTIPGLLYSAGMADTGSKFAKSAGVYRAVPTQDDSDSEVDLSGAPAEEASQPESSTRQRGEPMETQEPQEKPAKKRKSTFRRGKKSKATDGVIKGTTSTTNTTNSAPVDPENPSETGPTTATPSTQEGEQEEDDDDDGPQGVQLGLGDFIFYSVLVGRAALTDWVTIVTCSIACITGLCLTLLLLGVFRKALPALPISIALGILFYFLTSLILTPFTDVLAALQVFV